MWILSEGFQHFPIVVNTKEKILSASIKLFNSKGLMNVRLQHIADEVGISVGNLAYHYYSKEAIVNAIDVQLSSLVAPVISVDLRPVSLMDFDTQMARYYHLLMAYSFYFLDFIEIKRNYPKLYQKRKQYIQRIQLQMEQWLCSKADQGVLRAEPRKRHFKIIAHTMWMIITFYLTQPIDHGKPEDSERVFKEVIWSQILPLLSEIGRTEFDLMVERLLDSFTPETP